ncbi:hypothetical protein QEV83_18965 [Methylocapsa sp. D3K7]|uniref:hypothetical protein n=1 Tax=Methylocapsa sp. D3K7 TaxID=3041435 RepID=UPI00244ECCB9|nr:hypothetical protein [Methylocapsa sp. D3K7]WGJ14669.1 hypothetical protein QEV83_18965 [Methylocapsa sp. D3K7]
MPTPVDMQMLSSAENLGQVLPILSDPDGLFTRNTNRHTFAFQHGLKDHALFQLPSLIELARRPYHQETYWSNGNVKVTDTWGANGESKLTLIDTIANIGQNNSLVVLKHVEQDPVYAPVLQQFLSKVVEFSGEQIRKDVLVGEVLILISSPNRITSYHMDAECNFLVQAVGDKSLWVYDQTDRTLASHEQREAYYGGDMNSILYQESRLPDAVAYDLRAGQGVHIPVFAPHWVRNHDNISVALSVNYELRSGLREKRVYQMNRMLRKFGIAPAAPGASALRDRVKIAAAEGLAAARHFIKSKPAPSYAIWTPSSI